MLKQLSEEEQPFIFKAIKKQIKQALVVNHVDLKLYKFCTGNELSIKPFETQFFRYPPQKLAERNYTYLNGTFYILPKSENPADIPYALIDKLLYESKRHKLHEPPCKHLLDAIHKFIPGSVNCSTIKLEKLLEAQEHKAGTYYGECLSDDSDSDEEERYPQIPEEEQKSNAQQAKHYQTQAKRLTFFNAFKNHTVVQDRNIMGRLNIERNEFDRRQANQDLKAINERIKNKEPLDDAFLQALKTQFVVAQYRGIHYITTRWDKVARQEHRNLNEVGQAQYSSAVFASADVNGYHDMLEKRQAPDFDAKLMQSAAKIEESLMNMQQSAPCSYKGYAYHNLFFLLQKQYSNNYDAFPKWLNDELRKENSPLREFLKTNDRPLFSTSDVPNHALKYAFGHKLYEEHKHELLHPRWRSDLRAERPYSGKVYLSLHPLSDYDEHAPSHLTSLFKHGLVNLPNIISAERETSFLGYMPENRVAYHFKAKYPSFHGEYKRIYLHKYGIDEKMFDVLQQALKEFAPHTPERDNITTSLGDYLTAFHEVRLIATAEKLATEESKVLVCRDEDGYFSLYFSDTPTTANKRLRKIIAAERSVYQAIAKHRDEALQMIPPEEFDECEQKARQGLNL